MAMTVQKLREISPLQPRKKKETKKENITGLKEATKVLHKTVMVIKNSLINFHSQEEHKET